MQSDDVSKQLKSLIISWLHTVMCLQYIHTVQYIQYRCSAPAQWPPIHTCPAYLCFLTGILSIAHLDRRNRDCRSEGGLDRRGIIWVRGRGQLLGGKTFRWAPNSTTASWGWGVESDISVGHRGLFRGCRKAIRGKGEGSLSP